MLKRKNRSVANATLQQQQPADTEFECAKCGALCTLPEYALAHREELLTHMCPECGAEHHVQFGKVTLYTRT